MNDPKLPFIKRECPKCGQITTAWDARSQSYQCYTVGCNWSYQPNPILAAMYSSLSESLKVLERTKGLDKQYDRQLAYEVGVLLTDLMRFVEEEGPYYNG